MDAQPPLAELTRNVAKKETETEAVRNQYTYRQSVSIEEVNDRGMMVGEYREVRDIIFSPQQERTEQLLETPLNTLKRLILTPEDFQDIRQIQPLVLVTAALRLYETRFRGEERMDEVDCWVLEARPRQILSGMRLFEGLLWVSKKDYSIVRTEGQAVPQIYSTKSENLFPRFTTIRRPVDGGHWFPARTWADDTLQFRTGPQRIRLNIRYSEYKRFGAESSITFEKP
ncbi:MAG: hypothetical protein IT158_08440 [Bryobacterales bacterium]|nr:hypothetical protein [Bryobacterales bacterium]